MLEDDAERVSRFTATLHAIDPDLPLMVWRDAQVMVREVGRYLSAARLISLDHDLEPVDGGPDPGDGLEVVKFLVSQPVVRPVIIHTSNGERSTWMAGEFDLAGWRHWRVAPLGDDWIEVDWQRRVRRLLKKPGRADRSPRPGRRTRQPTGGFALLPAGHTSSCWEEPNAGPADHSGVRRSTRPPA